MVNAACWRRLARLPGRCFPDDALVCSATLGGFLGVSDAYGRDADHGDVTSAPASRGYGGRRGPLAVGVLTLAVFQYVLRDFLLRLEMIRV